ncbi:hypothetical protein ADIARSV_0525 [Arcticibacter svalbardensis MN12-7]|uniref:Uncharacterized protein n=1 Tax=Arcticibacter svalbardensis MN12-7 TaxID=1150600 RepID=R9GXR2_9SPHI|nr:hypothetical protein ADIARSV_0525 [Arcticibacter svalbardensis MN12-7]
MILKCMYFDKFSMLLISGIIIQLKFDPNESKHMTNWRIILE